MQRRRLFLRVFWLIPFLAGGCVEGDPPAAEPARSVSSETGTAFDPTTAGTITGQVTWSGPAPVVPSFRSWSDIAPDGSGAKRQVQDNPNAPRVSPQSQGVADAVVFLRGVDARRARPWDLPPVRVVQRDYRLHVCQGSRTGRDGFVRRGEAITMVSQERAFHALRAQGAAYFSLAFPDPDQPRQRTLSQNGLIELASAANYFWMRGYLFVDEHPYYTHTDRNGNFVLPQVPPGRYDVVCWLPNWREASHERDPETGLIIRLNFRAPVEREQSMSLGAGETRSLHFELSERDF